MRAPMVALNLWFIAREFDGLRLQVISHPFIDQDWAGKPMMMPTSQ